MSTHWQKGLQRKRGLHAGVLIDDIELYAGQYLLHRLVIEPLLCYERVLSYSSNSDLKRAA